MLSTHFRTACVIYFQMPFYIGNNSQDASATSPFCCVAAACQTPGGSNMPRTVSQDAEHRVRCFAFALFFFFFHNRRIKDRRRRGQTQRCAVCVRSEKKNKQIRKDPPSTRRGSRKLARFASCSSPMHRLSLVRSPVILPHQQPQSELRGSRSRHR